MGEIEIKLSKLLNMQLDNVISLDEYKQKKGELINQKTELKQKLIDFGRKGNYWLEPMRNFILATHQANFLRNSGNLEKKRSFLQKIGSNWQLCDKKVRFEALNELALLASRPAFLNWSGIGESNPHLLLGREIYYHCTNPANWEFKLYTVWQLINLTISFIFYLNNH